MPTKPTTLAEYRASLNSEQRATIDAMREAIIGAAPGAEVVFSYNMPGFKLDDQPLAWVAAWKHHYSMYPLTKAVVDAHADALEPYEMSKGTVRFPGSSPVPLALVRALVKTRIAEIRAGSRQGAKKKR